VQPKPRHATARSLRVGPRLCRSASRLPSGQARGRAVGRASVPRGALLLALSLAAILLATPSAAAAAQSVRITAGFIPERLGAQTAVSLGFQITAPAGEIPSPLTGLDFHFPTNLGLATSELGLATCPIPPLQEHGPATCPANSVMGNGSAKVEVPVGGTIRTELATIVLVAGPSQHGYINVLVTATGLYPVIARIIMPSLLQPGDLDFTVPLVESLPGSPYVSIVAVNITLGGHLTYYERVHGKTIRFHPSGVRLPRRCPRAGFPFSADFSFLDGSHLQASTAVPCPPRASRHL
jgi:hypothetical protein